MLGLRGVSDETGSHLDASDDAQVELASVRERRVRFEMSFAHGSVYDRRDSCAMEPLHSPARTPEDLRGFRRRNVCVHELRGGLAQRASGLARLRVALDHPGGRVRRVRPHSGERERFRVHPHCVPVLVRQDHGEVGGAHSRTTSTPPPPWLRYTNS